MTDRMMLLFFSTIGALYLLWVLLDCLHPHPKPRFDWRTPDTRFQIAHDLAEAKRWNVDWAVNFGQPWNR